MRPWPTLFLALFLAGTARAQEPEDPPVRTKIVSVKAPTEPVTAGEVAVLHFTLEIESPWHIYSVLDEGGPKWSFEGPVEVREKEITEPKPEIHSSKYPNGQVHEYRYHEGKVEFTVPVRVKPEAPDGTLQLKGKLTGIECDPSICLGFEVPFETQLTVVGGAVPANTKIRSVKAEPASAKAGEVVYLVFDVVVDPGWHIGGAEKGAVETTWEFDASAPVEQAGTVQEPKLKYKKTEFGGGAFMEEWYQDGEITFRVPVKVKPGTAPGAIKIAGTMVGQECSNVCRPLRLPFDVSVKVVEGEAPAAPLADDGAQTASQEEFQKRGLIGFLLLAMGGGLVSLLMPCTYPLIPITLTYFLKQGGDSRGRGALLATAYSAGMILSFTALGFILSLVLGEDGPRRLAANPWANIAIGAIFLYFAFSLFGLYEIALPSSITGSVASGPRSGVGGAFVLGLLFSIVTFSCTIPVLGVVLGLAASKAANFRLVGVLAMLVYSLTMALPFFFMGLFPSMLKSVPKSGGWLHTVKVTTAFAELALALAYIAKADVVWGIGALTRPVMVAIWVATLAFMALYLLGVFRLKGDMPPPHLGLGRVLTAMGFGILAIYLGTSSKSAGVFDTVLPPNVEVSEGKGAAKEEPLFLSLGAAMEEAKKTGKPIFVEFTGAT